MRQNRPVTPRHPLELDIARLSGRPAPSRFRIVYRTRGRAWTATVFEHSDPRPIPRRSPFAAILADLSRQLAAAATSGDDRGAGIADITPAHIQATHTTRDSITFINEITITPASEPRPLARLARALRRRRRPFTATFTSSHGRVHAVITHTPAPTDLVTALRQIASAACRAYQIHAHPTMGTITATSSPLQATVKLRTDVGAGDTITISTLPPARRAPRARRRAAP
jgi:hypothetical protein